MGSIEPIRSGAPVDQIIDAGGSDMHAIAAWLQTKQHGSAHTMRAYRAAAFMLRDWLSNYRQSTAPDLMITMTASEAHTFVSELFRPTQPNGGRVKTGTIRQKVILLSMLFEYWMEPRENGVQIVQSNPFSGISKTLKSETTSNIGSQRALTPDEVSQVQFVIEQMPGSKHEKHYARSKLIWLLASRMALRREEIANLKANDFVHSSSKNRWILKIHGKGRANADEPDVVVVPNDVLEAIRQYRKELGLFQDPLPSDSAPLLRRLFRATSTHAGDFMTPEHIARIMKSIFQAAAHDAARRLQNTAMEARLLQSSIHWGRHTWFVNSLKKHPIHLVSLGGRHRDIRTTQRSYVSLSEDDLAKLAD